jgi:hypothetical protein
MEFKNQNGGLFDVIGDNAFCLETFKFRDMTRSCDVVQIKTLPMAGHVLEGEGKERELS